MRTAVGGCGPSGASTDHFTSGPCTISYRRGGSLGVGAAGFTAPLVLVVAGSAVVALTLKVVAWRRPAAVFFPATDEEEEEEEEEEEDNGRREFRSNDGQARTTLLPVVAVDALQRPEVGIRDARTRPEVVGGAEAVAVAIAERMSCRV